MAERKREPRATKHLKRQVGKTKQFIEPGDASVCG